MSKYFNTDDWYNMRPDPQKLTEGWFEEEPERITYIEPARSDQLIIRKDAAPGFSRILTAEDRFPWCGVPIELFAAANVSIREIDMQEVDHILSKGQTELYPYFESMTTRHFETHVLLGIYVGDEPAGFVSFGLFRRSYLSWYEDQDDEAQKLCAELGLTHVRPDYRNKGIGSLLFDLKILKILTYSPEILFLYIFDKTGKIKYLAETLGFRDNSANQNKLHADPEYKLDLTDQTKISTLIQKLEERIDRKIKRLAKES